MFTRSSRSSFVASTFAAAFVALSLAACSDGASAEQDPVGDDELAEVGESELRGESYVGTWTSSSAKVGEFQSLALKAGGRYQATIAVCPSAPAGGVSCLAMPTEESGRFTILRSGTKQTLRLVPVGSGVRRYAITFAATIAVVGAPRAIELTRSGKSQVLNEKPSADAGGGGGTPCGTTICGAGLVCCNPLMAICTNPGDVCAQ